MGTEDSGFAIKDWTAVRFENQETIISGKYAVAMGNYFFTKGTGGEVKVEYSFGYMKNETDNTLRINLHHSSMPYQPSITEEEVTAAQKEWGDGIVEIAAAFKGGSPFAHVDEAIAHINSLYAYGTDGTGPVLFKPTLTWEVQFRPDFGGALSYFIGGDAAEAGEQHGTEDSGFAIKDWTAVRFENQDTIIAGTSAMSMGNYYFTSEATGNETKVEYSFGYMRNATDGTLRITLHHSSLPYTP